MNLNKVWRSDVLFLSRMYCLNRINWFYKRLTCFFLHFIQILIIFIFIVGSIFKLCNLRELSFNDRLFCRSAHLYIISNSYAKEIYMKVVYIIPFFRRSSKLIFIVRSWICIVFNMIKCRIFRIFCCYLLLKTSW